MKITHRNEETALTPRSVLYGLGMLVLVYVMRIITLKKSEGEISFQRQSTFAEEGAIGHSNATGWIWEGMDSKAQDVAMKQVMPYLVNFVQVLKQTKIDSWESQNRCDVIRFGSPGGDHQLCNITQIPTDCNFLSFGIDRDYSFDTDLAAKWNCRGFAADPTVVHKSQLHERVTFHNIGAKTLRPFSKKEASWLTASVPSVKKFLGLGRISVLKMDCEGCEFSLARDIMLEEPDFFHHVDQFTFEAHLNQRWLNDTESFYYMALLFKILEEAGLKVMGTSIGGCGWDVEEHESIPQLIELGYPNAGQKLVRSRRSCHEYLFARELR